jgi:hypothetical protein
LTLGIGQRHVAKQSLHNKTRYTYTLTGTTVATQQRDHPTATQ